MPKENLATIMTRIYLCNNSKLESIDDYKRIRKFFLSLDDYKFQEKLYEYGLCEREAS